MGLPSISTREDLDALVGTPDHAAFMSMLAGTLWRLEKDDAAKAWVAVDDSSTIERFGFTRADFPDAQPPALPEYVPDAVIAPKVVTMRQARLALLGAGLLSPAGDVIENMPGAEGDEARIEWEYAREVRRDSSLVGALSSILGLTEDTVDSLFVAAAKM